VIGLKIRDIDKDVLMMFALSYEYSMSFTNLLKLFKISKEYFWTFMEICSPMLKMGVRKASMLKKSVDKIYPYLTGEGELEELNIREEKMLDLFKWFVEDSFTDGDGCLTIEQLESIPYAQGYTDKDVCVALDHKMLVDNIDRVSYIKIGDDKYHKTSRALYYMEKFCGDLDFYQINNLSIRDMLRKIDEGEERLLNAESEQQPV
jgi:hypothetical protein